MGEIEKSKLVQHASLGAGKVVAVEPTAVHVFFPERGERWAVKLRLPAAQAFLDGPAPSPDPWLEGLGGFSLDAATGRYALPAVWLPRAEVMAQLGAAYPGGLAAPTAGTDAAEHAAAWRAAQARWDELLGRGEGARLLAAGELEELVSRTARVTRPAAELLLVDEDPLAALLRDRDVARDFFAALHELLEAPPSARAPAEALLALVAHAGLPGPAAWTAATLLPFLAQPRRHALLHPPAATAAADRLGWGFEYAEPPTWKCLTAFRAHCQRLLSWLEPQGAQDLIDVQCVLDLLAHRRSAARPRARAPRAKASAATPRHSGARASRAR